MDRELLQDVEKALTDLVKALARRRARMDAEDEAKRRAVPQSPPPPNLAPEAPSLQLGLESLLRMREVKEITKYSAATIYRKIKDGTFPRPIGLGGKAVRWRMADVQQWMSELPVQPDYTGAYRRLLGSAKRNSRSK